MNISTLYIRTFSWNSNFSFSNLREMKHFQVLPPPSHCGPWTLCFLPLMHEAAQLLNLYAFAKLSDFMWRHT